MYCVCMQGYERKLCHHTSNTIVSLCVCVYVRMHATTTTTEYVHPTMNSSVTFSYACMHKLREGLKLGG